MTGLQVMFAGSCFDSVRLAPDGVNETLGLWLQTAGFSGTAEYRAIDRPKGTGTMTCVHAKSVRDGLFVNARIRPRGMGNESVWIISIPAATLGVTADELFTRLKAAEPTVNGDEDKFLTSKFRRLFTYLDGKPISLDQLDPLMSARSLFETPETLEASLESADLRRKFVKKIGPRCYQWRKGMRRVDVPPLVQPEPETTDLENFVYSSDEDQRYIVSQLFGMCEIVQVDGDREEYRLCDDLPLLEGEHEYFFPLLQNAGLLTPVGPNPHGPLGQSWRFNQPLWLLATIMIKMIFKDDPIELDGSSGEYSIPPEASTPPSDPPTIEAPPQPVTVAPTIDELRNELCSLKNQLADAETKESAITGERSQLKRDEATALEVINAEQTKLGKIRLQLHELGTSLREINETVHRTLAAIPELEERITGIERESADHLAEQLAGLVKDEASRNGVSDKALLEALLRKLNHA